MFLLTTTNNGRPIPRQRGLAHRICFYHNPNIQVSRYPNIQVSRYPRIQMSKYPNIEMSSCPDVQKTRIQMSRYSKIQISRYQIPDSRYQKKNKSPKQIFRTIYNKNHTTPPPDTKFLIIVLLCVYDLLYVIRVYNIVYYICV